MKGDAVAQRMADQNGLLYSECREYFNDVAGQFSRFIAAFRIPFLVSMTPEVDTQAPIVACN